MNIKRYKQQNDCSYTLGATITIELLKKRSDLVRKVYLHSQLDSKSVLGIIKEICEKKKISLEYNDKVFRILSDKENCYVIGEFKKFASSLDLLKKHVLLVSPANAGNLGTIIRTAVGFKVNNIVIIRPAVDIFDPKTIRASMGALFSINFCYFDSFEEYQSFVGKRAFFPFMLTGSLSLGAIKFPKVCTLIFGNEATGLPEQYHNYGQSLKINQSNEVDSLNLPIAVGVALYEATKDSFEK
ncbi:MAG: TrmH family RNA methyltransferase [Bacilli bacterium]|nr:TrmH family RNA methyltransferase [Bacilli bacterium]